MRSQDEFDNRLETVSNLRYQPPRILNRFRQQTKDFLKMMDGKQQKVIKRQRQTREKEQLLRGFEGNGQVEQIVMNRASNISNPNGRYVSQPVETRVKTQNLNGPIIYDSNQRKGQPIVQKKVSPIIISKYKSEQSLEEQRNSSYDSRNLMNTNETKRIYLSSRKPNGTIVRSKFTKNVAPKPVRSVSPILKKKNNLDYRGKSSNIIRPRVVQVKQVLNPKPQIHMTQKDLLEKNEQQILDQNRKDNLQKEQINKFIKKKPVYQKVDPKTIKRISRSPKPIVQVESNIKYRRVINQSNGQAQNGLGGSNYHRTPEKRKIIHPDKTSEMKPVFQTFEKRVRRPSKEVERYHFVEIKSKVIKEEKNKYFEMQRNPIVSIRLSERPKLKLNFEEQLNKFITTKKKSLWVENLFYTSSQYAFLGVLKLWLYDTSGSGIFQQTLKEGGRPKSVLENESNDSGIAKSLYVFYGKDMSYFFVDEIPDDELPNPTDDYSILESKTPTSFNPMDSQIGISRLGERTSPMEQSKSFIYKQSKPNVFSDKAMQLKHKGLTIKQVIVSQIEFDVVKRLRKNSSKMGGKDRASLQPQTGGKFLKVLILLEKGKGVTNDRSLKVNTHKDVVHIAELDKELGYNFLKKCRINIFHGIFQVFESKQTNLIIILTNKGDLYNYNLITEELKLMVENPNNLDVTKQFEKVKSAEMFDEGDRIAISMGNGDFLVYQISYLEGSIEMMVGPYGNEPREESFSKTNQTFGPGFSQMLSTLDNKSIHSNTPSQNLPITIISSGEDPMITHRNILSTKVPSSSKSSTQTISFQETQKIHSILNDINISPNYIQQNISRIGGLYMMSHPFGHKIFFKKNSITSATMMINNSKVDTFFKKIIPFKRNKASDTLFMLGENGVILQIDFANVNQPNTSVFEIENYSNFDEGFLMSSGSSISIVLLSKKHEKLFVYDLHTKKMTYQCHINLLKGVSPGMKNSLLVGFDDCQMEMIMLSYHKIFKLILKIDQD